MSDPVDIAAHRALMEARAEALGSAHVFEEFEFNIDGFGLLAGGVCMVTDPDNKSGIVMSKDDALRVGAALINAAVGAPE